MAIWILIAIAVLIGNIVLLSYAGRLRDGTQEGNIIPLYAREGLCKNVKIISTAAHLLINILSSLLLMASVLCIQTLMAPKRIEVDKAHEKGKWLHIGIGGLKNLLYISWARKVLVALCFLSSIPLHMV